MTSTMFSRVAVRPQEDFVWVDFTDIVRQEEAEFADLIAKKMHVNAKEARRKLLKRITDVDEFGLKIPCIHPDSHGTDYKIMRVSKGEVVGYLCRDHVQEYVRYVKDKRLDSFEIRIMLI